MYINFFIKYGTKSGENIDIIYKHNETEESKTFHLNYYDKNLWHGSLFIDEKKVGNAFEYDVLLKKSEWQHNYDLLANGSVDLKKYNSKGFNIIHENFPHKRFIDLNRTKPFYKVFKPTAHKNVAPIIIKKATHIFEIESPFLQDNTFVCLTGSAKKMNAFDDTNPLLFKKENNTKSSIALDLSDEQFPIEFKIGIYDTNKNTIVEYEPGVNHIIRELDKNDNISIIHLNHAFTNYAWKAAGVNMPVFSIRTKHGWGTGEFTDLHLLVDYAASVGLKLIQLLPINDTTGAYTDKDSYPYSAITSFGLHPKFLNVNAMALASKTAITKAEANEIDKLNALTYSDHSAVLDLKIAVLKRIFEKEKNTFTSTKAWASFFEAHNNWLVPFAAFCVLRDAYKTPDFSQWGEYAAYDKEKIAAFSKAGSANYDAVLFWYFVQFNLHVQLENAIEYAHKKSVVLCKLLFQSLF